MHFLKTISTSHLPTGENNDIIKLKHVSFTRRIALGQGAKRRRRVGPVPRLPPPAPRRPCKSIVKLGYRGERLIEPSNSWFPPKFPTG